MWRVCFHDSYDTTKNPLFSTKGEDYVRGDTQTFKREPPFETFEGVTAHTPKWLREKTFLCITVYKYDTAVHSFDANKEYWEYWQYDPEKIIILVPKKENSVKFIVH